MNGKKKVRVSLTREYTHPYFRRLQAEVRKGLMDRAMDDALAMADTLREGVLCGNEDAKRLASVLDSSLATAERTTICALGESTAVSSVFGQLSEAFRAAAHGQSVPEWLGAPPPHG